VVIKNTPFYLDHLAALAAFRGNQRIATPMRISPFIDSPTGLRTERRHIENSPWLVDKYASAFLARSILDAKFRQSGCMSFAR
jgi:hypothetical protein